MLTLVEEGHPLVSRRFLEANPAEVAITILTVEEQLAGWYAELRRSKKPERLARAYRRMTEAVRFFSRLQVLTYTQSAMQRYEELRRQKVRIGRTDLRIAVIVLEQQAILVTRNSRDFKQVTGLQLDDWSR